MRRKNLHSILTSRKAIKKQNKNKSMLDKSFIKNLLQRPFLVCKNTKQKISCILETTAQENNV